MIFSIGINEETGEKTVGFRLGSYVSGTVGVAPINCLKNIPQRMKDAVYVSFTLYLFTYQYW